MGHLTTDIVAEIESARAHQQPEWDDPSQVQRVRAILASRPPLVRAADVRTLRTQLARVAAGEAHVVQCGDCAENPEDCTGRHVWRKSAVLDLLAGTLKMMTHKPVLRVGRIAGQFTKPRSNLVEGADGRQIPVFRGHMINGPEPDPAARRPDPLRILTCYMAAKDIMEQLGWPGPATSQALTAIEPPIWTSHEALLLDYEVPMIRGRGSGQQWLGSTHWPWVGERTRQVQGAHVALLAGVANPVAAKIGPGISTDEITALCERLDPQREPGRLTLTSRMGADLVADRLPALVQAVGRAGHPVIWLCDPMHGNTITTASGRKTRLLDVIAREIREFRRAVAAGGGVAGGIHLETTPDDVTECVADESAIGSAGHRHRSHCDPRLNPDQAVSVISAWSGTC